MHVAASPVAIIQGLGFSIDAIRDGPHDPSSFKALPPRPYNSDHNNVLSEPDSAFGRSRPLHPKND